MAPDRAPAPVRTTALYSTQCAPQPEGTCLQSWLCGPPQQIIKFIMLGPSSSGLRLMGAVVHVQASGA